jgi:Fe-S-cluster-containing hydrogenase component 2
MRGIISKDPETGVVSRKTEDCFQCAACAVMCPVGAVVLDHKENAFVTCDLCGGDPLCVKVCGTGALRFEDVEAAIEVKRSRYAQMVLGEEESL